MSCERVIEHLISALISTVEARSTGISIREFTHVGAPYLKRPIRHAEPQRGALETAVLNAGRAVDGTVLGSATDLLESGSHQNCAVNEAFEIAVQPGLREERLGWPFVMRYVADADRPVLSATID